MVFTVQNKLMRRRLFSDVLPEESHWEASFPSEIRPPGGIRTEEINVKAFDILQEQKKASTFVSFLAFLTSYIKFIARPFL